MSVLHGKMQLIFITPENIIENSMFRNILLSKTFKEKLVPLLVDEVHCIKKWGDQFRKAFSVIGDLRSLIPSNSNILTLVATATAETYRSTFVGVLHSILEFPPSIGIYCHQSHPFMYNN